MNQIDLFPSLPAAGTPIYEKCMYYDFIMHRVKRMGRTTKHLRKELKEEWYNYGKIGKNTYKAVLKAIDAVEKDIS